MTGIRNTIWTLCLDLFNGVWVEFAIVAVYANVYIVFRIFWVISEVNTKKTMSYMSYLAYKKFLLDFGNRIINGFNTNHIHKDMIDSLSLFKMQHTLYKGKFFKRIKNFVYLQDSIVNFVVIIQF